jgi:DNA-binding MarR family transcriptional regulator
VEGAHGEQIAEVLVAAAVLVVRHLSYGRAQNLTASTVLALLADDGPARISVLAAASGVSQPSMTELVGRLEREGLVTRFCDPDDGRATLVDITSSGRAERVQLQRLVHGRVIELLEGLSDDDQATLSLAMRVSAPRIEELTQLAAQHPHASGERTPSTT